MAYNHGKPFMKDGKKMCYRYTDKKKSTKKLVLAPGKKRSTSNKKKY